MFTPGRFSLGPLVPTLGYVVRKPFFPGTGLQSGVCLYWYSFRARLQRPWGVSMSFLSGFLSRAQWRQDDHFWKPAWKHQKVRICVSFNFDCCVCYNVWDSKAKIPGTACDSALVMVWTQITTMGNKYLIIAGLFILLYLVICVQTITIALWPK